MFDENKSIMKFTNLSLCVKIKPRGIQNRDTVVHECMLTYVWQWHGWGNAIIWVSRGAAATDVRRWVLPVICPS